MTDPRSPGARYYTVTQVRKVRVRVVPDDNESYAAAALRISESAFENPGDPEQGMGPGVTGMPAITSTIVERDMI